MAVKFVNQNWSTSSYPASYRYEDQSYALTWNTNAFSSIPSFSSGDTIFFAKKTSWDAEENVVYSDTGKTVSVSSSNVLTLDSIGKMLANITLRRIELNSSSTLTISNSAFSITDQVKMMGATLKLENAVVNTQISQTAAGTITLNNSSLNITQFSSNGLKSNITLTGSTMTVGSRPGSIKALQFNAGSAKTITLDLNSTLDVSGNIENSDGKVYTINAQIGDSPKLNSHTYQLLIVGGSIAGTITCTINGNDPTKWSAPEGDDHRYVDLGGHGMYITDLNANTVYINGDSAYGIVGTIIDKDTANEKLVGLNAGKTTDIVAATTSTIYLTGGNTSSYGNLDLSSQEQNTTIFTTGTGAALIGTLTTASGKTVTLDGANVSAGSITNNGTLTVGSTIDSSLASAYSITNNADCTITVNSDSTLSASSITNSGTLRFAYKDNDSTNNSNLTVSSINNSGGTIEIDVSDYVAGTVVQVTDYAVSGGTLKLSGKGDKTVSVLRDSSNRIWLTNTSSPVLYVNADWSGCSTGDKPVTGNDTIIYGINATDSLSDALSRASSDLSLCIYNGDGDETGYSFNDSVFATTNSFTMSAYNKTNAVTIKGFNLSGTGKVTFEDMKLQYGSDSFRARNLNTGTPTIEFSNVTYTGPGKTRKSSRSSRTRSSDSSLVRLCPTSRSAPTAAMSMSSDPR